MFSQEPARGFARAGPSRSGELILRIRCVLVVVVDVVSGSEDRRHRADPSRKGECNRLFLVARSATTAVRCAAPHFGVGLMKPLIASCPAVFFGAASAYANRKAAMLNQRPRCPCPCATILRRGLRGDRECSLVILVVKAQDSLACAFCSVRLPRCSGLQVGAVSRRWCTDPPPGRVPSP